MPMLIDQEHDNLDPEKTVWEAITDGNELIEMGGKHSIPGHT